jgi:hypothetical protein
MSDHSSIESHKHKHATEMKPEGAEILESPTLPENRDTLRRQYQNFKYPNPNLTNSPVIELAIATNSHQQQPTLADKSNYYTNPERNYGPDLENKIILNEKAAAVLAKNYGEEKTAAIFAALRGLGSKEINAISELSRDYNKKDFIEDIRNTEGISKPELDHLEVLLKGNKEESYASELNLQLDKPVKNYPEIKEIIIELDPKTLEAVEILLKDKYSKVLPPELGPQALKMADFKELLQNAKKEPEKLIQFLRELPPENYPRALDTFKDLEKSLPPDIREIAKAYLDTNRPLAESIYLNKQIREGTLSAYKIQQSLEDLSIPDRTRVAELYREQFQHNPYHDIKSALADKPDELKIAKQIIESSKLDESAKIYMLINEVAKDRSQIPALIRTLENKTENEMANIKQEIVRSYQTSLDSRLTSNLQGREQFEARLSIYGKPDTLEDEFIRRRAFYEFERLKRPYFAEKVIDDLAKKGRLADEEIEELEKQHRKIADLKEKLGEKDELHYYNLLNFFDKKIKNYEKAKKHYFSLIENLISALSAVISYMMTNEMQSYKGISLGAAGAIFLSSKFICKSQFKKTLSTEKALENFKDRRRKRKKSHKSRRKNAK